MDTVLLIGTMIACLVVAVTGVSGMVVDLLAIGAWPSRSLASAALKIGVAVWFVVVVFPTSPLATVLGYMTPLFVFAGVAVPAAVVWTFLDVSIVRRMARSRRQGSQPVASVLPAQTRSVNELRLR